jgi:hypothetical protein
MFLALPLDIHNQLIKFYDLETKMCIINTSKFFGQFFKYGTYANVINLVRNKYSDIFKYFFDVIKCKITDKSFITAAQYDSIKILKFLEKNNFKTVYGVIRELARRGNIEMIKWLISRGHIWDYCTFSAAVESCNFEELKWLKNNGCPSDSNTFIKASERFSFEELKWFKENDFHTSPLLLSNIVRRFSIEEIKWVMTWCKYDCSVFVLAIKSERLDIMKWLKNCNYALTGGSELGNYDEDMIMNRAIATKNIEIIEWMLEQNFNFNNESFNVAMYNCANLEFTQWLLERGCVFTENTFLCAIYNNVSLDVLEFLKENGCPWNESVMEGADTLEKIQWLYNNGCPYNFRLSERLVHKGKLEELKWIKEQGFPFSEDILFHNMDSKSIEVLDWLKNTFNYNLSLLKEQNWMLYHRLINTVIINNDVCMLEWLKNNGFPFDDLYNYAKKENRVGIILWLKCNGYGPNK